MLACGWVGRRRQAGWRQEDNEEEDGTRDRGMEGWKEGEERQGALGGKGDQGVLERGCFYEVKSVVKTTPKWFSTHETRCCCQRPDPARGSRTFPGMRR